MAAVVLPDFTQVRLIFRYSPVAERRASHPVLNQVAIVAFVSFGNFKINWFFSSQLCISIACWVAEELGFH